LRSGNITATTATTATYDQSSHNTSAWANARERVWRADYCRGLPTNGINPGIHFRGQPQEL
jgi:hypothetical protein